VEKCYTHNAVFQYIYRFLFVLILMWEVARKLVVFVPRTSLSRLLHRLVVILHNNLKRSVDYRLKILLYLWDHFARIFFHFLIAISDECVTYYLA